jgi:transcriptional regulator with XRE-family HTH domain
MLDRIKQLMEQKGLTASQFADAMEVPRAVISHVLSGRNKPSLDVILKIASTYSDVNSEWLLLGTGEMLNTLNVNTSEKQNPLYADAPTPSEKNLIEDHDDMHGKVQNNKFEKEVVSKKKELKKSIDQVMMFYSDGTFEMFKPAK